MSIFDDEITLPGVVTHVEADYAADYDSSLFGTTDSELVIGTAFNGPVGQPTAVYSPEHAVYMFGEAYDSKKRQEVSLVAGIQDAWDRGCRTIYAVRVGGKEVYKDFNFKIDTPYKLRLSSQFPSNMAKECYMIYDGTAGLEKIIFYKPSSRATIAEKKRGLTTGSAKVMKTTIKIAQDNGLSKDDRLIDLIKVFNGNKFNNVLKLSVVDKNGIDVTNSAEIYDLSIGALYSGAYFVGRSNTNPLARIMTETKFQLLSDESSDRPYSSFTGKYYRKLIRNTDVSLGYPIYDESMSSLRDAMRPAGVLMVEDWDFLEVAEASDKVFVPDDIDYEETNLSKFEIYKRLGCGYAITAQAIKRGTDENPLPPRIKESRPEDKNHVVAIDDGIYSTLQDSNARYRTITCVNADDDINGKLPKAEDFKIAAAGDVTALNGTISVKARVSSDEISSPKKYEISFENATTQDLTVDAKDIYADDIYKLIGQKEKDVDAKDYTNGTLLVDGTTLVRVGEKKFTTVSGANAADKVYAVAAADGSISFMKCDENGQLTTDTPDLGSKAYFLVDAVDNIFVYKKDSMTNLGDLTSILSTSEDKFAVAASDLYGVKNIVTVRSNMFDTTTLEEFVAELNSNTIFGRLFKTSLTPDGSLEKDDYILGLEDTKAKQAIGGVDVKTTVPGSNGGPSTTQTTKSKGEKKALTDRTIEYDYSLYIPYRTTDNFLRQLAQHCTYTELKTAPTHGTIGCARLRNTGLAAVSEAVTAILNRDFDLYAKNSIGNNMLDSNDLPYPIGRNVSLVFGQYTVTMDSSDYQYISNGAAGYAGFVSTLSVDQSSTGQTISIPTPHFQFTNNQLGRLTSAGIVTFKNSYTKGITVTDGVTMAPAESIYRRLSTSRIVSATEELIRAACEPFIGKENNLANRNALETAIKSNLDKTKDKIISDYSFSMSTDPNIAKLSRIEISYQIVPIYEIREVRNTIKMVDSITANA